MRLDKEKILIIMNRIHIFYIFDLSTKKDRSFLKSNLLNLKC